MYSKYLLIILSQTFSFLMMDTSSIIPYHEAGSFGKAFILLKFFSGIIFLFSIGILIGKLIKLNRYIK